MLSLVLDLLDDLPDRDLAQRLVRSTVDHGLQPTAALLLHQLGSGLSAADLAIQLMMNRVKDFPEAMEQAMEEVIGMRRLSVAEIAASRDVHAEGQVDYGMVRVMPSSFFTRFSGARAFVSFNIVHYPGEGTSMPNAVHELTHVAQYQAVGVIYIPQALHAQTFGAGYDYGDLGQARARGLTFRDFNREQQAQLAGDYYRVVVLGDTPSSSGTGSAADYGHFIEQMRSGSYW